MFNPFRRSPEEEPARGLYGAIVARSRETTFYEALGVADTLDGRFDVLALHAFLVMRRLKRDRSATARLSQTLFDLMFLDMDENLREMGVGDLSVGRRVKDMAKAFLGRVAAYEAALQAEDPAVLEAALRRNLYRGAAVDDRHVAAVADYVRRQDAFLAEVGLAALQAGELDLPAAAPSKEDA